MVCSPTRSGAPAGSRRTLAVVALGLGLALGLSACGDDPAPGAGAPTDGSTSTTGGTDMPDDTTLPTEPTSTTVAGGPQQPLRTGQTEVAVADLAARLGVAADAVEVVSTQAVTWRDSSLGCPQRGMMYLQVLTEGVQIILDVDGTRYRYHAGGSADPFYCATPEDPQSVG